MICAFCQTEFDETALTCAAGCPLAAVQGCALICCPHCGYQMVDERKSAAARLLRRVLERRRRGEAGERKNPQGR